MANKSTKSMAKRIFELAAGVALGSTVGITVVNFVTSKIKAA